MERQLDSQRVEREKRDRERLLRNSEGGKRARECDRERKEECQNPTRENPEVLPPPPLPVSVLPPWLARNMFHSQPVTAHGSTLQTNRRVENQLALAAFFNICDTLVPSSHGCSHAKTTPTQTNW